MGSSCTGHVASYGLRRSGFVVCAHFYYAQHTPGKQGNMAARSPSSYVAYVGKNSCFRNSLAKHF